MLQIVLTLCGYLLLVFPVGWYLYRVAEHKPTFCDALFNPIDNAAYALCGIDKAEMGWKRYALALLLTNAVMVAAGYTVLRLQSVGILNPNHISGMESSLSFNTVISFMTNTNLQHYSGESGMSYLSQTLVVIYMMFTSAATGYAACMMFMRGITGMASLGNYYVDMVRLVTRVLLPLAFIVGLALVFQGVPQTFGPYVTVTNLEGNQQDIALGPIASLVSIKHLGTNGGGFLGANSSTPQENPTIISNILELYSMMLLPGACVVVFGCMLMGKRREQLQNNFQNLHANLRTKTNAAPFLLGGEARTVFVSMGLLLLLGLSICYLAESAGNPLVADAGISQTVGNMEGKETRLGVAQSALFTTVTTSFTTGTVNNMHDTLTPLGGMVPLLHMMLNVVFGGVGVGFMNMLLYVLLTVFICGLMVGRTPEYLGKKVEGREMQLTTLVLLLHPLLILGFSALAVSVPSGLAGVTNPSFHGLTQILYEYSSSAANNGSGFEGLADNNLFWNLTTGFAMFYGRYVPIVLQLCIAGALLAKNPASASLERIAIETLHVSTHHSDKKRDFCQNPRRVAEGAAFAPPEHFHSENAPGTLRTDTLSFAATLSMLVLIFAALTFLPALALGPVAEHLTLWNS